jgi:hypothetical protein
MTGGGGGYFPKDGPQQFECMECSVLWIRNNCYESISEKRGNFLLLNTTRT